jgi:hypothetical protein
LMDSLKVLDPEGPIREADIGRLPQHVRKVPDADIGPMGPAEFEPDHMRLLWELKATISHHVRD